MESFEDIELNNCDIFVYNQNGQLIIETKLENKTSTNLSSEEAGTFILLVKYKKEKR